MVFSASFDIRSFSENTVIKIALAYLSVFMTGAKEFFRPRLGSLIMPFREYKLGPMCRIRCCLHSREPVLHWDIVEPPNFSKWLPEMVLDSVHTSGFFDVDVILKLKDVACCLRRLARRRFCVRHSKITDNVV